MQCHGLCIPGPFGARSDERVAAGRRPRPLRCCGRWRGCGCSLSPDAERGVVRGTTGRHSSADCACTDARRPPVVLCPPMRPLALPRRALGLCRWRFRRCSATRPTVPSPSGWTRPRRRCTRCGLRARSLWRVSLRWRLCRNFAPRQPARARDLRCGEAGLWAGTHAKPAPRTYTRRQALKDMITMRRMEIAADLMYKSQVSLS